MIRKDIRKNNGFIIRLVIAISFTISVIINVNFGLMIINLQNQKQEQTQTLTINYKDEELEVTSEDVEYLKERVEALEKKNKKSNESSLVEVESQEEQSNSDVTFLNELSVFNCQYCIGDTWRETVFLDWDNVHDKTSDGKTHKNAVYMRIDEVYACSIKVDFYLDKKYKIFNGNFSLDEKGKSTSSVATLHIYDENDNLLYEYSNITGGMLPQNTGNISVENINKIRFEFTSNDKSDNLGSIHNFGVVFYDSTLK